MENSNKIDKLDDAFLFALSSIGLIISFIQITMTESAEIIEAVPFLLLGIGLPFIVGYLRGAIQINSLNERMRGWIYFVIGTSSYFAFFIFVRIDAHFVYKEIVFLFSIIFGSFIAYTLLKWSKKVFDIGSVTSEYAFSGTALCAAVNAFLLKLIVSFYIDFEGKDIYWVVSTGSSEILFWISIILALFTISLIHEKVSAGLFDLDALKTVMKLPRVKEEFSRFMNFFLIKGLFLALMLFEHAFAFKPKACFLWLQAFVFWILGCLFWVAGIPIFPQVFFLVTIIFASIAIVIFHKTKTIEFEHIDRRTPTKSGYALMVAYSTVVMVLSGSLQTGVLLIILATISYILLYLPNQKDKRTKTKQQKKQKTT